MIHIREARMEDVGEIRDIFLACYGVHYPYAEYYQEQALYKLIYSDDTLLLVAEETETKRILGTASVVLEVGALSDLVGEFGRLAVHPDARNRGVGRMLMAERLRRVQDRLQVGIVDARVSHPYTLKIAEAHDFRVVGFMPQKMLLAERESLALLVRYFGTALELRCNHPRIIPEVAALSQMALENCSLPADAIIDEETPAYPPGGSYDVQTLTTDGYASLLRIERGRVRHREIFGPVRLHYGFFKLQAHKCEYLIAREDYRIAGAIGFTHDPVEKIVHIFELITLHDDVIRFLLNELLTRCQETWKVEYIEVEVSAMAPRMQRTLLELGFLPVAYVPALVFVDVERLDVIKFARLLTPLVMHLEHLSPRARSMAELVLRRFRNKSVLPRIAQAVQDLAIFAGLDDEQIHRLAGVCTLRTYSAGQVMFQTNATTTEMLLILQGTVNVTHPDDTHFLGTVTKGECLGEVSLLTASVHSAEATAQTEVEAAILSYNDLLELTRQRPDIGLLIYRNLASGLAAKLKRAGIPWKDRKISGQVQPR